MRNCGLLRFIHIFLFHVFICKYSCAIFNACLNNPCNSNGYCISNQNGGFYCQCSHGWTGSDCSVDVNECHLSSASPCEHNGVCVNSPGSYQCLCPPGYYGSRCENEVLECALNPCKHDGTCVTKASHVKMKSMNAHLHHCEDLINGYACHCLPGWTGTHCEDRLRPCANSSLCLNNATCLDLVTTDRNGEMNESADPFVCLCAEGFRGKLCETKIINYHCMDTIVCQNGGKCTVDNDGREYCKCLKNYQGVYCEDEVNREDNTNLLHRREEQKEMQKRPCHNEGICISQDLTNGENQLNDITELNYTCICRPGYSGKHCEINIFDCFNQPCGSYGICKDEINGYHCECLKGWKGSHCEKFSLAEPVAHQKITGQDSTVVMHNISQRLHFNESRLCPENYCANSAICISISYDNTFSSMLNGINELDSLSRENEYKCLCETAVGRFEGGFCDIDVDECDESEQKQLSPLCQNGGQCINTYGSYVCQCTTEYYGDRCEYLLNPCNHDDASICFNGGECLPISNNGIVGTLCICPKGFTGPQCEEHVNECNNKQPCAMNDGICLDLIGTYHCLCPAGRYGTNCEYTSKQTCINHLCSEQEQVNVKNCITHTCFNGGICTSYHVINGNIEAGNNNSFNRNVTGQNNLLNEQKPPYCSCPFGYIGEYCQIELDFCQLFHHIKHFLRYFNDLQEMEDYFVKNLTISSYIFNDWLISSAVSSKTTYSWYEINAIYSTFIINYINSLMVLNNATTTSNSNSNSNTKKILSVKNLFINSSLLDRKSTQPSNSTLFMINSPIGLCNPIGSSQCVSSISSAGSVSQQSGDGFTCICLMDYEGRYCEKYVDFCDKANKQYNGMGKLESNYTLTHIPPYICRCPFGWSGIHCEVSTGLKHCDSLKLCNRHNRNCDESLTFNCPCIKTAEEIGPSYCLHENCYLKKHNGQCDHECNMIACNFDHGDCLYALSVPLNSLAYIIEHIENNHNASHYVSFSQDSQIKQRPEPAIPWRSCSALTEHTEHTPCHLLFADGNCDKQCSEEECLFDGWDCMQVKVDTDNTTKEICSGQYYYYYEEVLTMYSEKLSESILSTLNEILHLEVEIEHHPYTGNLMVYPVLYITNYTNDDTIEDDKKSLFKTIQLKDNNLLPLEQMDEKSSGIRSRYSRHVNRRSSESSSFPGNTLSVYQKESIGSQVYLRLHSKKCDETGYLSTSRPTPTSASVKMDDSLA
ncbi:Neurogenic locus Notch protein [Schistosoma japonicum]|nr:Neurogenic locus Notch protein [Schistosoma japonicum]